MEYYGAGSGGKTALAVFLATREAPSMGLEDAMHNGILYTHMVDPLVGGGVEMEEL
jgi:hypothetical protein